MLGADLSACTDRNAQGRRRYSGDPRFRDGVERIERSERSPDAMATALDRDVITQAVPGRRSFSK